MRFSKWEARGNGYGKLEFTHTDIPGDWTEPEPYLPMGDLRYAHIYYPTGEKDYYYTILVRYLITVAENNMHWLSISIVDMINKLNFPV